MAAKPETESQQSCGDGIEWREEWLYPSEILRSKTLQVRKHLDRGAIRKYADMTRAGMVPPLIKVAEVTEKGAVRYYLVDGWHRWEADALVYDTETGLVRVLCAPMSKAEAEWQGAQANMNHGVPLKRGERRNVFRAFIHARKHKSRSGTHLSYRAIGTALGMNHNTLRNWMRKDFPAIWEAMSKTDPGGAEGGLMECAGIPSVLDEVMQDLDRTSKLALSLLPEERDTIARYMAALLAKLPVPPPKPDDDEF